MDTGSFTDNIVPSAVRIEFNVRYSWQFNQNSLSVLLRSIINSIDTEAEVSFSRPCEAYLSKPNSKCGALLNCLRRKSDKRALQGVTLLSVHLVVLLTGVFLLVSTHK